MGSSSAPRVVGSPHHRAITPSRASVTPATMNTTSAQPFNPYTTRMTSRDQKHPKQRELVRNRQRRHGSSSNGSGRAGRAGGNRGAPARSSAPSAPPPPNQSCRRPRRSTAQTPARNRRRRRRSPPNQPSRKSAPRYGADPRLYRAAAPIEAGQGRHRLTAGYGEAWPKHVLRERRQQPGRLPPQTPPDSRGVLDPDRRMAAARPSIPDRTPAARSKRTMICASSARFTTRSG